MNYNELRILWQSEERQAFEGWDFSYIQSRWHSGPLPWNYKTIIGGYLEPSHKLLDMGTGGGEFLLTLNHPPENTTVTEAWAPNVRLCRERLEPLGIQVHMVSDDDQLPFRDNTFDIVLNRHESYDLDEVSRILKPGGMFVTQQVGGENNRRLSTLFKPNEPPLFPHFYLTKEIPKFERHRLRTTYSNEAISELRFDDVGAVIYYAKIIEWEYPNFSVDRYFQELCVLHNEALAKGYITSSEHRFIIAAQNMKES